MSPVRARRSLDKFCIILFALFRIIRVEA